MVDLEVDRDTTPPEVEEDEKVVDFHLLLPQKAAAVIPRVAASQTPGTLDRKQLTVEISDSDRDFHITPNNNMLWELRAVWVKSGPNTRTKLKRLHSPEHHRVGPTSNSEAVGPSPVSWTEFLFYTANHFPPYLPL